MTPTTSTASSGGTGTVGRGIAGVGIDAVEVSRLRVSVERTPTLVDRIFTTDEQADCRDDDGSWRYWKLAARFAAKEATAKALGAPGGLRWRDAEVVVGEGGRPVLQLHGGVAEEAASQGIRTWHLSMSHDGGIATAVVVAES